MAVDAEDVETVIWETQRVHKLIEHEHYNVILYSTV